MNLGNRKLEVDKQLKILSLEEPDKSITFKDLIETQNLLENTFNIHFKYGILKREPGYYFSYNLDNKEVIVCGTMNKKECVERTREYVRNL